MDQERFEYHYDKDLHIISQLDIVKHIENYEGEFFYHLHKENFMAAEKALTDLMGVLTKMPERGQLDALRIYLTSLISEIARMKMRHGELTPYLLANVTALIKMIESWTSISEYFSSIPWLIKMASSKIRSGGIIPLNRNKHIVKAIQIISRDITKPITVTSLAEKLDLNPSYLSRIFKQEMNMTIVKFINMKRSLTAAVDLKYSTLTIQEISAKYRFYNQSYFTKIFKETHGVTPKNYRKNFMMRHAELML